MKERFDDLKNKQRILGYYIQVMDRFIDIANASISVSGVISRDELNIKTRELEDLKTEMDSARQEAWESWYAYGDSLQNMENYMYAGDIESFEKEEDVLSQRISDAEKAWVDISVMSKKLGSVYSGEKKESCTLEPDKE
ncbi:MAG: hypothetical protein IKC11_03785 [Clostridia bacterium]|nr:hypothetical protein [Clostridia bacterium]